VNVSGLMPGGNHDAQRREEAARLRREHPGWIVVWLAPGHQFRAYRRLPGSRRDTALNAAAADDLTALITQADKAARPSPGTRQAGHG
jgi:hypothetical protein